MPYNRTNYLRRARYIIEIYKEHKHEDVTDAHIVRKVFPKYNIHLSYRTWMNLKGLSLASDRKADQLTLNL